MPDFPHISLVLGGARSGKSAWGERFALSSGLEPVYLATAGVEDDEMRARVAKHQARRAGQWRVLEAPRSIAPIIKSLGPGQVVLVDCLTLWLSNQMFAGADIEAEGQALMQAIAESTAKVVMVSNELGLGLVPESSLGRAFRDWQGWLNQGAAEIADPVVFVAAGLPLLLKGQLPEGRT